MRLYYDNQSCQDVLAGSALEASILVFVLLFPAEFVAVPAACFTARTAEHKGTLHIKCSSVHALACSCTISFHSLHAAHFSAKCCGVVVADTKCSCTLR